MHVTLDRRGGPAGAADCVAPAPPGIRRHPRRGRQRPTLSFSATPCQPAAAPRPALPHWMGECWVCQEGAEGGETTHGGCACRGSAGLVHQHCLVQWADSEAAHRKLKDDSWKVCPTCEQAFTGRVQLEMARALWERVHSLQAAPDAAAPDVAVPQDSFVVVGADVEDKRLWGAMNLAAALAEVSVEEGRDLPEALQMYQAALEGYSRRADGINTAAAMAGVASTHRQMGNLASALPMTESSLAEHKRLLGTEHRNTLTQMGNLAAIHEGTNPTNMLAARQVSPHNHLCLQLSENSLSRNESNRVTA